MPRPTLGDDLEQRPPTTHPGAEEIGIVAGELEEHPSDRFARERHRRPRIGWWALAASGAVNAALALLLGTARPEPIAPPQRTVRLVFATAPPPPVPPPPRKGSGMRAPTSTAAGRSRTILQARPSPEDARPVAPTPSSPPPEPARVASSPLVEGDPEGSPAGVDGGVEGGVAGGIPGGIVGGVLGGVPGGSVASAPELVDLAELALVSHVEPSYPSKARKAGVAGLVVLEIIVEPTGTVGDVKVVRSVPLLDGAAVDAVRQWRFLPWRTAGGATRARALVQVEFDLLA